MIKINNQKVPDFFPDLIQQFKIEKQENNNVLAVAVSGGADSMALTLLTNKWAKNNNFKIVAVTVDHQLRSASGEDALFVAKILKLEDIEHHILNWEGKKPKQNIEALAREARYNLLTDFCKSRNIRYLLLAHHLQDQAETFLIRLFRGSGLDGLSAMSQVNEYKGIKIIRPLLQTTKDQLKEYLIENNVSWVEDETNDDERYLRNKIRKFLESFDKDRKFDDKNTIIKRISFSSQRIRKIKENIEQNLIEKSHDILKLNQLGYCELFRNNFISIDEDAALKYLAWALMEVSGNYYKPRFIKLNKLYQEICKDQIKKTRTFYGCIIEKISKNYFVIYREFSAIGMDELLNKKEVTWDKRFKIFINGDQDGLSVTHINPCEFNELVKKQPNDNILKQISLKKGWEKKIIFTLPVVKKDATIVAIPLLGYYINNSFKNKVIIKFQNKTKLYKN